jgi:hypothetical protein
MALTTAVRIDFQDENFRAQTLFRTILNCVKENSLSTKNTFMD